MSTNYNNSTNYLYMIKPAIYMLVDIPELQVVVVRSD